MRDRRSDWMAKRLLGELRNRLSPLRARLCGEALASVTERCLRAGVSRYAPEALLEGCLRALEEAVEETEESQARAASLSRDCTAAPDEESRRKRLLEYIHETVSEPRARRKDEKALRRWLDLEAILERENRRTNALVQQMQVIMEIMRRLVRELRPRPVHEAFTRGGLGQRLLALARPPFRDSVRAEAIETLGSWLNATRLGAPESQLAEEVMGELRSRAEDRREALWVQVAALRALAKTDGPAAVEVAVERLQDRGRGDDFIVRRNCLRLLGYALASLSNVEQLLIAVDDPSEHVRQELARCLANNSLPAAQEALTGLIAGDASARVRAVALRELSGAAKRYKVVVPVASATMATLLGQETDPLVLRVALQELGSVTSAGRPVYDPRQFVDALVELCTGSGSPVVGELAAHLLRTFEVLAVERASALLDRIRELLSKLREGESEVLPVSAEDRDDSLFSNALRLAARPDMAVSAEPVPGGYRVHKGEVRRRRLWRVLHELRHPAPDKRQGFAHTSARSCHESVIVPPVLTAEVTPTGVPGERRFEASVGGWAPYVPRVDDLLAVCFRRQPLTLLSSAGALTLRPPRSPAKRLAAWLKLTWNYAKYAAARDASVAAEAPVDRERYLKSVAALGFRVEFDRQPGRIAQVPFDVRLPTVEAYLQNYSFLVPVFLEDPISYFLSDRGNSPLHLAVAVVLIMAFLLIRSAYVKWRISSDRERIPLRVGGWGTRGKSGTERIKAALLQGLGFDVVVKTTGCEAMFIHGFAGRPASEIFIYRPFGKATIWEQAHVLSIAARLNTQVMLWECMALRPRFVEILNRDWMRDELTTLTNAYPDHEDVMGPGGEDVARVIGSFMPRGGVCITTEEQMLPLLREGAAELGSRLIEVPSLEAELIPQDLLARFPYEEHPRNIALVAEMAEFFGVERERAMVEMADNVVPDIGVLKTYPETTYRGRTLEFSNGMSANERAGFLASWQRLGFDTHNADSEPEVSIVTVVNNRDDRVPRSRVFARIMVRDINADRHVLIGTNLNGLMGFVQQELEAWLEESWVAQESAEPETSPVATTAAAPRPEGTLAGQERVVEWLQRFDDFMRRLKVPAEGSPALRAALERMLRQGAVGRDRLQTFLEHLDLSLDGMRPEVVAAGVKQLWAEQDQAHMREQGQERGAGRASRSSEDGAFGLDDPQIRALRSDIDEGVEWTCRRFRRIWDARTAIARGPSAGEANRLFRKCYRDTFMEGVRIVWDSHATGDQVIDAVASAIPPGQSVRIMGIQNIKGTGLDFIYRWLSLERVQTQLERLDREQDARAEILTWLASYSDYGVVGCRHALQYLRTLAQDRGDDFREHSAALEGALTRLQALDAELSRRLGVSTRLTFTERALEIVERWIDHIDATSRRRKAMSVVRDLIDQRCSHDTAARLMRELTARDKGGWLAKSVAQRLGGNSHP